MKWFIVFMVVAANTNTTAVVVEDTSPFTDQAACAATVDEINQRYAANPQKNGIKAVCAINMAVVEDSNARRSRYEHLPR